jgi:hypothetical protein
MADSVFQQHVDKRVKEMREREEQARQKKGNNRAIRNRF